MGRYGDLGLLRRFGPQPPEALPRVWPLTREDVAAVVRDRDLMKRLWEPTLVTWFPKGLEDRTLALLRVEVRGGEYWDVPSSTMVEIIAAVQTGLDNPPPVDTLNAHLTSNCCSLELM